MCYNARWCAPYLKSFTAPDSIVPNPYNPQDYNRYSYTRNNPINYTDPSGHDPWWAQDENDPGAGNRARVAAYYGNGGGGRKNTISHQLFLEEIAAFKGTKLSPGDHWSYEQYIFETSRDENGQGYITPVAGRTPKAPDEEIIVLNDNFEAVPKIADDSAVYITKFGFTSCSWSVYCIGGIMDHEATHSWIEYLGSGSALVPPEAVRVSEEIVADAVALAISGDSIISMEQHQEDRLEHLSGITGYDATVDDATRFLGAYYRINDLSVDMLTGLVSP